MVVMRGRGEDLAPMAPRADRIRLFDAEAVRVVAVAADHARAVHPALEERAPHVDLVEDLTVRVVQALLEERGAVAIEESVSGLTVCDPGAA